MTLREGKLGSENRSLEGYVGGATLPYQGRIEIGVPGRGHRASGPKGRYSPSPVGKNPVPLGGILSDESKSILPAKMKKVLEREKVLVNGLSSIIIRSGSDDVHARTRALSRDDFEKWKSIFCELNICSLNICNSRPFGDGH